ARPRRRAGAEEARRTPRGKRSAWSGKQQTLFISKLKRMAAFSFSCIMVPVFTRMAAPIPYFLHPVD
ncbi:hypothetical protein ABEV62_05595, partial [Pseudobacillus badius]